MILILSYNQYEQGTDPVIDWLLYLKADFIKVTVDDLITKTVPYSVDVNTGKIFINNVCVSDKVNIIFFRRFGEKVSLGDFPDIFPFSQAKFECNHEIQHFINYLYLLFADKKWMPHFNAIGLNKLEIIKYAAEINLPTPKSVIVNNKRDAIKFLSRQNNGIISKPIHHSGYFVMGKQTYSIFTNTFTEEFMNTIPDYFFPTLLQEKINAHYEIRVFYIDSVFYSTAILINKEDRDVDIKLNYGKEYVHWVPYNLPEEYQKKIDMLMKKIGLNTGSIDIIKTTEGNYVFLEVNPVGQYTAPSNRCNYSVDKIIAEWLIKNDN